MIIIINNDSNNDSCQKDDSNEDINESGSKICSIGGSKSSNITYL